MMGEAHRSWINIHIEMGEAHQSRNIFPNWKGEALQLEYIYSNGRAKPFIKTKWKGEAHPNSDWLVKYTSIDGRSPSKRVYFTEQLLDRRAKPFHNVGVQWIITEELLNSRAKPFKLVVVRWLFTDQPPIDRAKPYEYVVRRWFITK